MRTLLVPAGGFRRIAVLRLSSLGDVILSLPVIRALAAGFPRAHITYWTKEEYRDVLRFEPAIAHVRSLEKDARRIEDLVSMGAELEDCDLIVDLHVNARTRVLTWRQKAPVLRSPSYRLLRRRWVYARWSRPMPVPHALTRYARTLEPIGVEVQGSPEVEAGPEAEVWAERWITDWDPESAPLAICPGARHFTKRWPEAHWVAVNAWCAERGIPRVYFSLAAERQSMPALAAQVERDGNARWLCEPLARVAAAMSLCAAALTSDSGLMHLAAARGLRVVALFGSTAPELGFAPGGDRHVVLCRHEPCQPCTLHGRPACPKRHFRCMLELKPDRVVESVVDVLGEDHRLQLPS